MVSVDHATIIQILANDTIFCNNWKLFCKGLDFDNATMRNLEKKSHYSSITDLIIDIMEHWKSMSTNANTAVLANKLRDIRCVSSAERIVNIGMMCPEIEMRNDAHEGIPSGSKRITSNFEYLTENLTDIRSVMVGLVSAGILTMSEKSNVMSRATDNDKSDELFTILVKKDLNANDLEQLISILENKGNAHVAAKLK